MKLLFKAETIEYNVIPSVEEVLETTNELLSENFYFSHYISDGVEVNEAPEEYLEKNLMFIDTLEIIALHAEKFVNDLLLSAEEYINRSVPYIKDLTDAFYNSPLPASWNSLGEMFEGIQWLSSMIDLIDRSSIRPTHWDSVIKNAFVLHEELKNFEEAMENTDTVLIADLLLYEILPVFEELEKTIKLSIDTEGTRHDLN